jgi:hypothetical protein
MVYTRNQPVAGDDLDVSQPFLVNNTNSSDDSFNVNHYGFSNLTANNGKHDNIQTPLIRGSIHPTTPAGECAFYAMQDTNNLGLIQYSKGPSNAVATPVTFLQSPSTPISLASGGSTTNVLDFTGISVALAVIYATDSVNQLADLEYYVAWGNNSFNLRQIFVPGLQGFGAVTNGNILQIRNNSSTSLNNVYWTLQLLRIQV